MTALLEQLQHVLATWDAADNAEEEYGSLGVTRKRGSGKHEKLFVASVEAAAARINTEHNNNSNNNNNGGANDGGGSGGDQGGERKMEKFPLWLTEIDCDPDVDENENANNEDGGADVTTSSARSAGDLLTRRRITKVELARAALALFTSNAGIYRPVLQKTLGFIFGLIDELLERGSPSPCGAGAAAQLPVWSAGEKAEVTTAHERMRVMEAHMARLVDDAATQRDHLRAELAAAAGREARLQALLRHQIVLSHAQGLQPEEQEGQLDAHYVKRLIARAENEKAVDELLGEVARLEKERDELSQRLQSLLSLNGKYAQMCIELSARLSILSEHNINTAMVCQKHQNEYLMEKHKCEKYQVELQITRNILMSALVNRHRSIQSWWDSIRESKQKQSVEAFLHLVKASGKISIGSLWEVHENAKSIKTTTEEENNGNNSEKGEKTEEGDEDKEETDKGKSITNETSLYPLWFTRAGSNPDTPDHLRSVFDVPYFHVNPFVAERFVHVLLSEWRIRGEAKPLDVFTRDYLLEAIDNSDADFFLKEEISLQISCEKKNIYKHLPISYALDAVSTSHCCGSLTYAFGLVSRRKIHPSLFRMLEYDASMILSICKYLDMKRSLPSEPHEFIPVVQFAAILAAMYPSYSVVRLSQLLDAARNDGSNPVEFRELIYYNVLFPERLFLDSVSNTVDYAGALSDTLFIHILYKFICDDVEESWQSIEDTLHTYGTRVSIASEQQLLYQGFKYMSEEDTRYWFQPIKHVLLSWTELKTDKASILLEELPRVSVKTVGSYLRNEILIRRGPRPSQSAEKETFLSEQQDRWNEFSGGNRELDWKSYVRLVESLDAKRHMVWGSSSMAESGIIRFVDPSVDVSVNALLAKLQENS